MSRRKCALLSLVVILVGTLALASPDGPYARLTDDQPGAPDENTPLNDAPTPLLQKLSGLLPQIEIEIDAGSKTDCPECRVNRIPVTGPQQVQMRLLVAEVAQGKLEGMGIRFSPDGPQGSTPDEPNQFKVSPDSSMAFGKVKNADELRGFLRALKQEGHARIIAQPTLVTFTGRPASMVVGGEFPIQFPDEHGKLVTEVREYGTRIECLPVVLGKNRIRLEVRPELSSLDFANGVLIRGFIVPGIMQRRIDTSIEVQSGETYVVGGLRHNTTGSASRGAELLERAWLTRTAIGTCLSGLFPSAPFIPDPNLIQATRAIAEQDKERKELIVMVTADLVDPLNPNARQENAEAEQLHFKRPQPVAIPSDSELFQAGAEMDVDQPHAPAILLTPLGKAPGDKFCSDRPRVRLSEARVSTSPSQRILFGVGADSDSGLAGNIAVHESEEIGSACRDNCCVKSDRCQPGDAGCCRQTVHVQKLDDDECDDEEADECVESFISQVLQSQMQYLEGMMRARLHHEKELMEAKVAAESALAKQKAEHVGELMKLRVEHMAEILAVQESIWDSERKALSDRHRDAIDYERELAELRAKHVEELQTQRIAALESEVERLRGQADSGEPERVAHSSDDPGRQSRTTRRPVLVELPIHVEELASGRVRYSPIPPKPTDPATNTEPRDVLERVELTTPPIATTRPTPTEIERLRHEVARLHALIEDLICVAPEAPPSPQPQSPDDDDD